MKIPVIMAHEARTKPMIQAQNPSGQDNCKHINGGPGIQKGSGRPKARTHPVDTCKQGKYGAGTDGKDSPCRGGYSVGHRL